MSQPSQATTRYEVVLASDEFKDFAEACPEMSHAEEITRGDGTVIIGPEVILSCDDENEVKSQLRSFAKRAMDEKKHLALIIREFFDAGNGVGTQGTLIFLDTEKILTAGV